MTTGQSDWRSTGNTTREAFRVAIARSWTSQPSPMRDEADAVYDALAKHGLSRLGAAMAWHESKNASWNCASAPKGEPCIPLTHRNPWAFKAKDGGWMRYGSYAEAARDWGDRLLSPNGPYKGTGTLKELVETYAPGWDGNDTVRYVETICNEIDALPLEGGEMGDNPFPVPKIYDLSADYFRFGLTKWQMDKVRSHRFVGRNGYKPKAVFLHIQEGTTQSSLNWWASGNADASSTVMIQKDGSVLRVIPEADGPWTNGDVASPTPKGQALVRRMGNANVNLATLSIEAEGYWQETPPEAQIQAICWQVRLWLDQYGLALDRDVYRHADINQQTRPNCPGAYFDIVMKRLREAEGTAPAPAPEPEPKPPTPIRPAWPDKPEWLDADAIPFLFPEADPDGIRTRAWLRYCNEVGRAPARKAFLFKGESRELICFDDGMQIDLLGRVLGQD